MTDFLRNFYDLFLDDFGFEKMKERILEIFLTFFEEFLSEKTPKEEFSVKVALKILVKN